MKVVEKKEKRFSLRDIKATGACYGEHDWQKLRKSGVPLTGSLTLLEILDLKAVEAKDKIWLACRLMSMDEAVNFAVICADRALHLERKAGREPDGRTWDALKAVHAYQAGRITKEELTNAASAAANAAANAAYAAAVAVAVASYAAANAAYAAADSAAYASAAYASADSADSAAYATAAANAAASVGGAYIERQWQIKRLVKFLKTGK